MPNRSYIIAALAAGAIVASCSDRKPTAYSGPYAKQVSEAVPAIENAVGLKFKKPPKVESRSKQQVREFVTRQITDPVAARQMAGMAAAYKRLGMIPDSLNLQKFLIDLLEEQIVGYYDPKTKVLYVVSDAPKETVGLTITHELVRCRINTSVSIPLSRSRDRTIASRQRRLCSRDRQFTSRYRPCWAEPTSQ
jgi:hypothetical protein